MTCGSGGCEREQLVARLPASACLLRPCCPRWLPVPGRRRAPTGDGCPHADRPVMIERLLSFSHRRRGLVLLLATTVLAVSVGLVTRITFDANILKLLPRQGPAVRSFDTYLEHFGTIDHIYVLFDVPPDHLVSDEDAFVEHYIEQLRKAPEIASVNAELFDEIDDWGYLLERSLLLVGPESAREALNRFTPLGMAEALVRSRALLAMPSPDAKAYVQQDPLGLGQMLRDRLVRSRAPVDVDSTARGYVSRDGQSRLVIAKPVRPPFDTSFCKALFARLAEIEAAARAAAAEEREADQQVESVPVTVRVAGGYRIALEADRVIRRELIANSTTSLVGLLLLVLIVFRTPWVLLYGTVPLVLAGLLTLGLNGLAGPVSPATSGNSAMLFGLGIDGLVLMYLRYLEERGGGLPAQQAMARTSGTAASVMVAYGTTAATFLALVLVDFPSLVDLGRFVGLGILACFVLLLTLLPALIGATAPRTLRHGVSAEWLGRFVGRHGRAILVAAACATVVLGVAGLRLKLNTGLEKLKVHTEATALEEQVASRFGLARDVVVAVGEGPELEPLLSEAHALSRAVERQLPSVAVLSPDTVLPPLSEQEAVSAIIRRAGLDAERVAAELARAGGVAGFRPGTFEPFIARLPDLLDPATRISYDGLVGHGLGPLLSHHVARVADGFLVVVYLYPRTGDDIARLERLVTVHAPSFNLTGVEPVNRELAARFLPQFIKGVSIGTLAVAVIIFLVFRRVSSVGLAFLPTALGLVWSAGLLAMAGLEIDLFSLFAALTFVGIATDYALHILHRHSIEGTRPISRVLASTGAGVMVASGTTLIGFGSLINSSYPPLHSFGVTAVTAIACSAVASLLVLPALLQEAGRS